MGPPQLHEHCVDEHPRSAADLRQVDQAAQSLAGVEDLLAISVAGRVGNAVGLTLAVVATRLPDPAGRRRLPMTAPCVPAADDSSLAWPVLLRELVSIRTNAVVLASSAFGTSSTPE